MSELNRDNISRYENILLIDDSIDTGNTLRSVLDYLKDIKKFNIKIATLNIFEKEKPIVSADYSLYTDTIIKGPWSEDSIEYEKFLEEYFYYKENIENKRYRFEINMNNENSHKKILERIKEKSKVLEIGTAYGHMSKYLKENLKCEVTGIEIDEKMLSEARKYLESGINLNIENTDELNRALINDEYDYIILGDVLEHTVNVEQILRVLKNKIKKSGEILVSVPNASHNCVLMQLLKNDFTYQAEGILDRTHISFFTSKSFKKIAKKAGLRIKKHDFTYMTPEYEKITNNNYREFSPFENEVLLRHKNGHFFQNIFILSKDEIEEAELINIDAYNFDKLLIKVDEKKILDKDMFELNEMVLFNLNKDIEKLEIYPTFRMRIIEELKIFINEEEQSYQVKDLFFKDERMYSFGKGYAYINKLISKESEIKIVIKYKNLTEELLKEIIIGE